MALTFLLSLKMNPEKCYDVIVLLFCSLDCCPSGALSTIFPLFKTNQEIVNLYYIHINDQTQRNKQRDSEKLVNMVTMHYYNFAQLFEIIQ
ncbi:CDP-alcohol phosphatidyltransferase family protein [Trichinella spiralis]|uniref:CDP-alcohol phosphatidyltransferase family protein n=1 Tax=Trichinella spiralis TaxID=6334 RepID=UPI0001EFB417|nr:CDP-alcohol phosphatidyltransferase family protein [Trichinella spiralis]